MLKLNFEKADGLGIRQFHDFMKILNDMVSCIYALKLSQIKLILTTDNKKPNSRLPDYVLKISRVFIQTCFFKPLLIVSRLKLDTFNFEYVQMYELSQSVRMIEIEFSSIKRSEFHLTEFPKLLTGTLFQCQLRIFFVLLYYEIQNQF